MMLGYLFRGPDISQAIPTDFAIDLMDIDSGGKPECYNGKRFADFGHPDPLVTMNRIDFYNCQVCDLREISGTPPNPAQIADRCDCDPYQQVLDNNGADTRCKCFGRPNCKFPVFMDISLTLTRQAVLHKPIHLAGARR
jgi:hypothetical protein